MRTSILKKFSPALLVSLVFITILPNHYCFSQNPNEAIVSPITGRFPTKQKYRRSAFENGYLITVLEKRSQVLRLNFDLFTGLPQYIDEKGDTLFLGKGLAKFVRINELMYFHDFAKDAYYEIVVNSSPVKLAIQRVWKLSRVEEIFVEQVKAPGTTVNVSRNSVNTVYSPILSKMVKNENTVFKRDSSYFFIDKRDNVYKANERNLLKIFEKDKSRVNEYLQQESLDFKKEEDLKKVLQFAISNH